MHHGTASALARRQPDGGRIRIRTLCTSAPLPAAFPAEAPDPILHQDLMHHVPASLRRDFVEEPYAPERRQPWNRRLALGWIIARPWWRQGFGTEAPASLLVHCFTALDTHRVETHIEPGNAASRRLAARLGFRQEGPMRGWLFVDGQPRDMVLYALLRADWTPSPWELKSPP